MTVVIHAEFEKVPQEAAALRDAKSQRMGMPAFSDRVRGAFAVGALVAQKRDQIAHRGKADAEDLRPGRLVPDLVDLERRELRACGQQPDRLASTNSQDAGRDFGARVAFAVAHRRAAPSVSVETAG